METVPFYSSFRQVLAPIEITWTRQLTDVPYRDAKRVFEAAWSGHYDGRLGEKSGDLSLKGRVTLAVTSFFLAIPLVNILVDFVLRRFFPVSDPTSPPESGGKFTEADARMFGAWRTGNQPSRIQQEVKTPESSVFPDSLMHPIQSFIRIAQDEGAETGSETPKSVASFIDHLRNEIHSPQQRQQIVCQLVDQIYNGDISKQLGLPEKKLAFLAYNLLSHLEEEEDKAFLASHDLTLNQDVQLVQVPADGNCFLWSVAVSRALQKQKVNTPNPDFTELRKDMENLRENMVKRLHEKMQDPDEIAFRKQMLTYVIYCGAFNALLPDQATCEKFLTMTSVNDLSGPEKKAYDNLLKGYEERLKALGEWNGEVEAQLVSEVIGRPIIIYTKAESGNETKYKYRTIAGTKWWGATQGQTPVRVVHHQGHYEALRVA